MHAPDHKIVHYPLSIGHSETPMAADPIIDSMSPAQLRKTIEHTRRLMQEAAKKLNFMEAAQYRDELLRLTALLDEKTSSGSP